MTDSIPRWDLSNIYTGLDDSKLAADLATLENEISALSTFFDQQLLPLESKQIEPEVLSQLLSRVVDQGNSINLLAGTIDSYLYGLTSTDSFDKPAEQLQSKFQIGLLPLRNVNTRIAAWLGKINDQLPAALAIPGSAHEHAFFLMEEAQQSQFLMSEPEEELANELSLSGGSAWGDLQGTLTSQKQVEFEIDGKTETLPLPALINLRSQPSADVRERAYHLEQATFEDMKEALAACLNGVKGEVNTLDRKRGREDSLHSSLDMARIDRQTLEAMIGAIQDSLPMFRDYFRAKAKLLGSEKLPWWSLFAPVGSVDKTYTFEEAKDVILTNFTRFSPELSDFARHAFENNWIDALQRPGKRGGAYCMGVDGVKESRIMSNFDGSFDQVMTLAHELGHAFHNYCAFQADKTPLRSKTPMTLAETASIMCENIVFNALLEQIDDPQAEQTILETSISSDAQTIVDIYSRFLFEREVFERRKKATLSADEISEIMLQAQRDSYGDGIDPEVMNKFAWTWKPHYYSTGLSFYNYPYAFGNLFAKGLYAIYQEKGAAFVEDYKALLASTGEASAADLAARFGIDIRSKGFWATSLAQIAPQIERYKQL
ncbi:MAG: M3 family oligoendopeptidase [Anaerolineaceae bacterium]|nr:M3 family oligoendopeptidase [Anaerolineaceae bacterium]MDD4042805.1 M3 family oligoendopeptidase [Anaerolineaceae bacterium]MDD4577495.1 M3 family oligoendopeptidase [Anaerolineaceae bacterium]